MYAVESDGAVRIRVIELQARATLGQVHAAAAAEFDNHETEFVVVNMPNVFNSTIRYVHAYTRRDAERLSK